MAEIQSPMNRLFSSAGQAKPQTGTGYTNLNRFMQANQGNQLGQKVAGNVQSQLGGVKAQLGEQKTAFEKETEQKRLDTDANKNEREAIIGRFADPSTQGGELSEQDTAKFAQFRAGQYAGPSGLKDTQALSQQAGEIRGQTANLTPSGTQELLRRTVGGDRYTQGQQRLDSLLLDRSGLKQVGREAAALGTDINRANLAAQGQAQQLAGQAQQFGAQTTEALTGALSGLDAASQAQLATAQAAEKDRLARINAIQDFAQNKVAKRDAQGNIVVDEYGKPVFDTTAASPRGASTDEYKQIDNLRTLLLEKGANQDEVNQLLGGADFSKEKGQYDAAQEAARRGYIGNIVGGEVETSGGLDALVRGGYLSAADAANYRLRGKKGATGDGREGERLKQAQQLALRDLETKGSTGFGGIEYGNAMTSGRDYNQQYTNAMAEAEKLYSPKGLAGRALKSGKLEDFYQNLAGTLGQSQAAQGLTEQGTASQQLRANYGALEKLLGKGADLSKFRESDQKYEAGKFLLDPERLARTL